MSNATLPTGKSDTRFETSAAVAEVEASNDRLSQEVGKNAGRVHDAAVDAAHAAEFKTTEASSAVNQLEEDLSHKTNAAATEGAGDVQAAKEAATGYVGQAKELATNAIGTAQSYISGSGQPATTTTTQTNGSGIVANVQSTVQTAVETGKGYLASATTAAQPYVDSAVNAAQPYIEKVSGVVSGTGTTNASAATGKPSEVPAATAPLESGPNVVGNPYPATTGVQTTKVGEL